MGLSIRESNFHTALKKQIRLAIDSGGRPTLTALVELTGGKYHQFQGLIEKLTDLELQGLDYDLKKIGIDCRAIASLLNTPRSVNRSPRPESQDSSSLEAIMVVFKALAPLSESDRKRIMDTVEIYFFGPKVRPFLPSKPAQLEDFAQ